MGINLDDEVLQVFLEESCEHLSEIEGDLLALEQQGADADDALVNRIFRAVHTVKGGSGFFGLTKLGELAHVMESLLDRIREREFVPDHDTISILLSGSDILYQMVSRSACLEAIDASEIKKKIEAILYSSLTRTEKNSQKKIIDITLQDGREIFSVNKYDFERATKSEKGGFHFYLLEYDLIHDVERKGLTPWEVISDLLELTFFIDSKVDLEGIGTLDEEIASTIPFYALVSTILDTDLIYDVLHAAPSQIYCVKKDGAVCEVLAFDDGSEDEVAAEEPLKRKDKKSTKKIPASTLSAKEVEEVKEGKIPAPAIPSLDAEDSEISGDDNENPEPTGSETNGNGNLRKSSTVRVDVNLLDQLMSLAGELVLIRNQLVQSCASCDSLEVKNAAHQCSQ